MSEKSARIRTKVGVVVGETILTVHELSNPSDEEGGYARPVRMVVTPEGKRVWDYYRDARGEGFYALQQKEICGQKCHYLVWRDGSEIKKIFSLAVCLKKLDGQYFSGEQMFADLNEEFKQAGFRKEEKKQQVPSGYPASLEKQKEIYHNGSRRGILYSFPDNTKAVVHLRRHPGTGLELVSRITTRVVSEKDGDFKEIEVFNFFNQDLRGYWRLANISLSDDSKVPILFLANKYGKLRVFYKVYDLVCKALGKEVAKPKVQIQLSGSSEDQDPWGAYFGTHLQTALLQRKVEPQPKDSGVHVSLDASDSEEYQKRQRRRKEWLKELEEWPKVTVEFLASGHKFEAFVLENDPSKERIWTRFPSGSFFAVIVDGQLRGIYQVYKIKRPGAEPQRKRLNGVIVRTSGEGETKKDTVKIQVSQLSMVPANNLYSESVMVNVVSKGYLDAQVLDEGGVFLLPGSRLWAASQPDEKGKFTVYKLIKREDGSPELVYDGFFVTQKTARRLQLQQKEEQPVGIPAAAVSV